MVKQALLFLNGHPPIDLPKNSRNYEIVACTDGAYSAYLAQTAINIDLIIGDLDSLKETPQKRKPLIIHTPNQYKTDFEKALSLLISKGIKYVDIYGATGYCSDHSLGNLSVALRYHKQINMRMYDDHSYFFFADKETHLYNVKNKIISIMPFHSATNVTLKGFVYPLSNAQLKLGGLISLRNQAASHHVSIHFKSGNLLIFVNQQ